MTDMRGATFSEDVVVVGEPAAGLNWSAIVAGAVTAAALALVLQSFAAAIGLSVASAAPTWRDTSVALVFLSGLYLVLAALASYGLGGYVAGRIGVPSPLSADEIGLREGMHGLLVWALATLLTAMLVLATVQSLSRAGPATGGPASAPTSVAGESLLAFELDRLFRGERGPQADIEPARAEAARILLTTASHDGMQADDRTYLIRLVASTTGLSAPDAERRVNDVAARARTSIDRARRSTVVLAFMVGAAALLGAAAAWFAADAGARHRDGRAAIPLWLDWGRSAFR